MNIRDYANEVLRMHYGVAREGKFKRRWLCPEAEDFPETLLKLRKEKTRGHGLVEYSWDCPKHPEHCVREIWFDTKSMQVVEHRG
ncbi:MAG: hypothetical protein AB1486_05850 [Planctomycetota bacterium]